MCSAKFFLTTMFVAVVVVAAAAVAVAVCDANYIDWDVSLQLL